MRIMTNEMASIPQNCKKPKLDLGFVFLIMTLVTKLERKQALHASWYCSSGCTGTTAIWPIYRDSYVSAAKSTALNNVTKKDVNLKINLVIAKIRAIKHGLTKFSSA